LSCFDIRKFGLIGENNGKYSLLQGQNTVHKLPMATIKIRSPWFNYDRNVTFEAAVCKLRKEFSNVIGNSLFRRHRQLQDVISVRRHPGQQTNHRMDVGLRHGDDNETYVQCRCRVAINCRFWITSASGMPPFRRPS